MHDTPGWWQELDKVPKIDDQDSVLELREAMKCYVSFPDEAVFSSMALLEEPSTTQPEEATPKSAQPMQTDFPVGEATAKITEEPTKKEQTPNQFPG